MAEFGLAVNVATVVDLLVKVGVQCSVYCSGVKAAPRDVRDILSQAENISRTLDKVNQVLSSPCGTMIEASEDVLCSVKDCHLYLVELNTKLVSGATATGWKRMMWPLKRNEVDSILMKLERSRTAIHSNLQIYETWVHYTKETSTHNLLLIISPRTLSISTHQQIILNKLRTVERARFDTHADTDDTRCLPGTRTELINQIQAWVVDDNSKHIFWLNGMAGTGKSTISRTTAQGFAKSNTLGASFFFKRGEGDRGRASLFFPTLAAQLIYRLPPLTQHILDAIEADPSINHKALQEQFDTLIAGPIKKLPKASRSLPIAIVIDALDECDDLNNVRRIIYLLSKTKDFTSVCLKFFITSRPELDIQIGFKDIYGDYEDLVLHEISQLVIEHDIDLFLKHELARIREDYNKYVVLDRRLPSDWPSQDVEKKLVEMAIPLFISATTICRLLQDRRRGGPQDQLKSILKHQGSQGSDLDSTYLPVMNRLLLGLSGSQRYQVAESFKQIVGSIVILADPLSIPSLALLLDVSQSSIEDQLDLFHSVLNISPDPSTPVRLLHLSFRDFLVDPEKNRQQEKCPFWVDERQTHELLATKCLQLLLKDNILKRDICSLRYPGTYRPKIKQRTIEACLPPAVQYACQYWAYHWKQSQCLIHDGGLVSCFLTQRLLFWLEALAILGNVSESLHMIADLSGLLDVCSMLILVLIS